MTFNYIFGVLFGSVGGSFLGVIVERGFVFSGRSRCGNCRHQLSWYENIPLISFILLKGKCRKCHSPIPYWLPLIELAGAAAGVVIASNITFINFITIIKIIGSILIAAALIWIFFSDLVYGLIPDWAVVLGSLGAAISHWSIGLFGYLTIGLFSAAFFLFLVLITKRRGMGTGDITLAFFLGLWLGWPLILPALWLAFVIGAIFGITLIIFQKKKLKSAIPFGPFLILGSLLAIQWGQILLDKLF